LRALDEKSKYRYLDKFGLIRIFTVVKPTLEWTKGVPSRLFEYAFEDLTNSVSTFFKNVRATRQSLSHRKIGFPEFISYFQADTFSLRDTIKIKPDKRCHGQRTAGTIELPKGGIHASAVRLGVSSHDRSNPRPLRSSPNLRSSALRRVEDGGHWI
jgi:hypothetical protein